MKKGVIGLISLFVVMGMLVFFTACSDDDNGNGNGNGNDGISGIFGPGDLEPEQTDFHIGIGYLTEEAEEPITGDYIITINAVNPEVSYGNITFTANGEEIELYPFMDTWYGGADFIVGESYEFALSTATDNYSATLTIPYNASSTNFPETFDPTQSYTVVWSLEHDNENQIAHAWSYIGTQDGEEPPYWDFLDTSAREYTFPANAVESHGEGTDYGVGITQANFRMEGKLAIAAISSQNEHYPHDSRTISRREFSNKISGVIELLK
jgi:hypothetical protein